MRISSFQAAIGSASVLLSAQPTSASIRHRHAHVEFARRHLHGHGHIADTRQVEEAVNATEVVARKATCTLPDHPDLVYIPGKDNNGFAMSPDQSCNDGDYCPIACVPGKVMAQWKPGTTYTYPESMVGLTRFSHKSGQETKGLTGPALSTEDSIATVGRQRSPSRTGRTAWMALAR